MADDSELLVLAIAHDDTLLHVGSAAEVLAHLAPSIPGRPQSSSSTGSHAFTLPAGTRISVKSTPAISLQLFDSRGVRLTIHSPRKHPAVAAVFPPDTVPERVLLARISAVLDHMQKALDANPDLGKDGRIQHDSVPRPDGSLIDVLTQLAALFEPLDPRIPTNRGNWLHNLAHAAGL
ncbi:MAG TPA: hypothetical protein VIT42_01485 [Microlunatus sp.]